MGLVDLTHAARAEGREDLVRAERGARLEGHDQNLGCVSRSPHQVIPHTKHEDFVPGLEAEPTIEGGSIRVSQRYFQAFWGFSWVISWERPCGSSWKTRSVFQGAVGAFCASTAPSASTGPVRGRQDGSQGGEPGVMSNWTAASSDCGRDDVHIRTADLYRPNARFTPERQRYQVLTPFGKLGYSLEGHILLPVGFQVAGFRTLR